MKRPSGKKGDELSAVVPDFTEYTDRVLYEDVWERPGLSKRDRSLVTISALISLYRLEQLPAHLGLAMKNGVTKDEIAEAILHLAFYASWPNAVSASRRLLEVVQAMENEPEGD